MASRRRGVGVGAHKRKNKAKAKFKKVATEIKADEIEHVRGVLGGR